MRKEDCYLVGIISRRHGLKGNVILRLDTDQPEFYQKLESIFVEINGLLVPFFIESSTWSRGDSLNIAFQNVSEPMIDQLLGRPVYLPLSTLPPLTGKAFYYHEVVGYQILDQHGRDCGTIQSINDQTAQHYFVTQLEGKDLVLPLLKDWILQVDRPSRTITMELPDGLREVFLDPPGPMDQ